MTPQPAVDSTDAAVEQALDALREELPRRRAGGFPEYVHLRDLHGQLRDQGNMTGVDVQAWVADRGVPAGYQNRRDYYTAAIAPFLALFPGVSETRGRYTFDPDDIGVDRPTPPDDPVPASEPELKNALSVIDFQDDGGNPYVEANRKHRLAVRRMYDHLATERTATAPGLRDVADPWTMEAGSNDQGIYPDAGAWFARVGRDALAAMPGVDAPDTAGRPWVFVGVDVDADATDQT
jgi:hypothetical protein